MTIRNIVTSAAIAVVLGLSAGTAFAESEVNLEDTHGFMASANAQYPGMVFIYKGVDDVDEGEVLTNAQSGNNDHPKASIDSQFG
ncbi:MAG: hypothetical protein HN377_12885 [Alphaproteobacteria bacterium]|jgi:hypothetical protein|nr:hypothetical protein [Alphaproteobacteria bacterium]MBT7943314.1 hypothetical protein [Alphaproteobacteria bacterium]